MPAAHLTDKDFAKKVLEVDKPVLVDFFAPWCGPCQMAGPIIDSLAEKYKGKAEVLKLNVDENQESAGKYSVMSIPTVIMFKDGKEFERKVGFPGEQGYIEMIEKAIK